MQVLVGATLIDGTDAPPLLDSAVVIDGERITTAGARGSTSWPARAEVVGFRVQGPRRLETPKVYGGEVCLPIAADNASRTTARTAGLTAAFVRSASR